VDAQNVLRSEKTVLTRSGKRDFRNMQKNTKHSKRILKEQNNARAGKKVQKILFFSTVVGFYPARRRDDVEYQYRAS
jgi:hypothetical protein